MMQWQTRDWPGNVRELRNFADRLVLGVADIASGGDTGSAASLPDQIDGFERALIADALTVANGNVALTAERLGMPKKRSMAS